MLSFSSPQLKFNIYSFFSPQQKFSLLINLGTSGRKERQKRQVYSRQLSCEQEVIVSITISTITPTNTTPTNTIPTTITSTTITPTPNPSTTPRLGRINGKIYYGQNCRRGKEIGLSDKWFASVISCILKLCIKFNFRKFDQN